MSPRAIGFMLGIAAFASLAGSLLFIGGCEKKSQGPGQTMTQTPSGPGKPRSLGDTMSATITGPVKDPKPTRSAARVEAGDGNLGVADFGAKKKRNG